MLLLIFGLPRLDRQADTAPSGRRMNFPNFPVSVDDGNTQQAFNIDLQAAVFDQRY